MSGETEASVSGWTTDTLHTHLTRQLDLLREAIAAQRTADKEAREIAFRAQDTAMRAALASAEKAVAAALAAQEKSVDVANVANEKRLDSVNEFRGQQADILRVTMPRAEAEAIIQRATERIQELAALIPTMMPRSEADAQHARFAEQLNEMGTRMTTVETMARAAQLGKTGIYAAIGAAVTILGLIVVIANAIFK